MLAELGIRMELISDEAFERLQTDATKFAAKKGG